MVPPGHPRISRLAVGAQQRIRQAVTVGDDGFRGGHLFAVADQFALMDKHFQRQRAQAYLIPLAQTHQSSVHGDWRKVNHQPRHQAAQAECAIVQDNLAGATGNRTNPVLYWPAARRGVTDISTFGCEEAFCGASAFQFIAVHHL
ncbi:hypothetical protein SDC9_192291 [bioreactor metagenome]|uniref:Uncharacterized protein n=1 Tax=bioreactor metagenome TaxID=1076179 RepID=A0A645I1K9_9ZZZZ